MLAMALLESPPEANDHATGHMAWRTLTPGRIPTYHPRVRASPYLVLLLVVLPSGCAPRQIRLKVEEGSSARAISLLGDTLWTAPVDPRDGPRLVEQLQIARAMVSADPMDLRAQLALARQTAAIGQLREAVLLLNQTAKTHYLSPRVMRQRGEVLLGLRELDQSYRDFEVAQDLLETGGRPPGTQSPRPAAGRPPGRRSPLPRGMDTASVHLEMMLETTEGPDSTGPVTTSVEFQIALHMGVIRYLQGDFLAARDHLTEAARRATSDDDMTLAALWLFFATRRAGNTAEATEILAAVQPDWLVQTRWHEHQMLLGYKGQVPTDSIQSRALARLGGEERALYSYGIGFMLLVRGRTDEAELWLQQARMIPNWTAMPYLAAEADLARLRGRAPRRE
jgi:tetratricopeptide (TPR) repeat protein